MSYQYLKFRSGVLGVRFSLGILVTLSAACSPAPERAAHTVEEYRADEVLRNAEFARCANDPGSLERTADCRNVREAKRLAEPDLLRALPPLRLPAR